MRLLVFSLDSVFEIVGGRVNVRGRSDETETDPFLLSVTFAGIMTVTTAVHEQMTRERAVSEDRW